MPGRIDEALTWAPRARELEPLGISGVQTGWILLFARRYDRPVGKSEVYLLCIRIMTTPYRPRASLIGKGQYEDAIPVLEKTITIIERSPGSIQPLATAYGYAGRRAEALRLINELKQRRQTSYISAGVVRPILGTRPLRRGICLV